MSTALFKVYKINNNLKYYVFILTDVSSEGTASIMKYLCKGMSLTHTQYIVYLVGGEMYCCYKISLFLL